MLENVVWRWRRSKQRKQFDEQRLRSSNVHGEFWEWWQLSGPSKCHYVITGDRFSITTTSYTLSAPDQLHLNSTMDLLLDSAVSNLSSLPSASKRTNQPTTGCNCLQNKIWRLKPGFYSPNCISAILSWMGVWRIVKNNLKSEHQLYKFILRKKN